MGGENSGWKLKTKQYKTKSLLTQMHDTPPGIFSSTTKNHKEKTM